MCVTPTCGAYVTRPSEECNHREKGAKDPNSQVAIWEALWLLARGDEPIPRLTRVAEGVHPPQPRATPSASMSPSRVHPDEQEQNAPCPSETTQKVTGPQSGPSTAPGPSACAEQPQNMVGKLKLLARAMFERLRNGDRGLNLVSELMYEEYIIKNEALRNPVERQSLHPDIRDLLELCKALYHFLMKPSAHDPTEIVQVLDWARTFSAVSDEALVSLPISGSSQSDLNPTQRVPRQTVGGAIDPEVHQTPGFSPFPVQGPFSQDQGYPNLDASYATNSAYHRNRGDDAVSPGDIDFNDRPNAFQSFPEAWTPGVVPHLYHEHTQTCNPLAILDQRNQHYQRDSTYGTQGSE